MNKISKALVVLFGITALSFNAAHAADNNVKAIAIVPKASSFYTYANLPVKVIVAARDRKHNLTHLTNVRVQVFDNAAGLVGNYYFTATKGYQVFDFAVPGYKAGPLKMTKFIRPDNLVNETQFTKTITTVKVVDPKPRSYDCAPPLNFVISENCASGGQEADFKTVCTDGTMVPLSQNDPAIDDTFFVGPDDGSGPTTNLGVPTSAAMILQAAADGRNPCTQYTGTIGDLYGEYKEFTPEDGDPTLIGKLAGDFFTSPKFGTFDQFDAPFAKTNYLHWFPLRMKEIKRPGRGAAPEVFFSSLTDATTKKTGYVVADRIVDLLDLNYHVMLTTGLYYEDPDHATNTNDYWIREGKATRAVYGYTKNTDGTIDFTFYDPNVRLPDGSDADAAPYMGEVRRFDTTPPAKKLILDINSAHSYDAANDSVAFTTERNRVVAKGSSPGLPIIRTFTVHTQLYDKIPAKDYIVHEVVDSALGVLENIK